MTGSALMRSKVISVHGRRSDGVLWRLLTPFKATTERSLATVEGGEFELLGCIGEGWLHPATTTSGSK